MKAGSAILLSGALFVAGAALASEPPTHAKSAVPAPHAAATRTETAHGAITALDATKKTVTVKGAESTWTFETSGSTHFLSGTKSSAWSALKVGEKVTVTYRVEGSRKLAENIEITH